MTRTEIIEKILERNRQLNGKDQEVLLRATLQRVADMDLFSLAQNLGLYGSKMEVA